MDRIEGYSRGSGPSVREDEDDDGDGGRSPDERDIRWQKASVVLYLDRYRGCHVLPYRRHAAPYSGDTSKIFIA